MSRRVPRLPPVNVPAAPAVGGLRRAQFNVQHRGQRIGVSIDHDGLHLTLDPCAANPHVHIRVAGAPATLTAGQPCHFPDPTH